MYHYIFSINLTPNNKHIGVTSLLKLVRFNINNMLLIMRVKGSILFGDNFVYEPVLLLLYMHCILTRRLLNTRPNPSYIFFLECAF